MAVVGTERYEGGIRQYSGIAGVNDNDIVIETNDVSDLDTFELSSTAGAMDVFVSQDGTNFNTAARSVADLGAITTDPVIVTAAGRSYGFRGVFKKIRVRQNGVTAVANAVLVGRNSD